MRVGSGAWAVRAVALVALGTLGGFAYLTGSASFLVRGVLAALGLMLLSAAVTPGVKASLHMAFAGLARHRPHELIIGLGLDACAGAALVTFSVQRHHIHEVDICGFRY